MPAKPLHRSLLLASLGVILAVTLLPIAGGEPESWRSCVVCSDRGIADVLVNVLLFLPFGAGLAVAGVPLPRCLLAGALLSAGVEFAQLYIPGRDPSLGDVVSNTCGSGLGSVVVTTAPAWLLPAGPRAARLARAAAVAAAVLCYVTGWLLAPAPPPSRYWALWTPNLADLEWYRGRVQRATIGGLRLPAGRIVNSAAVREQLLSPRGLTLQVRAIAGPPPPALGALLTINDEYGREVALLGPDRDDVVFRFRTRAAAWRLDQPDIRVPHALRDVAAGDTVDVTVRGRRGRYAMTVDSSSATGLGFTVGGGWAVLMYPETLPAWLRTLLGLAWIAAICAPAGFWARTRRDVWIIGGVLAAGLLGAPAVTPLCATPLVQWAAAALGGLGGASARVFLERRDRSSSATDA